MLDELQIVFNFFSLVFPYVGQKLGWKYLDPLGGALLSVYSQWPFSVSSSSESGCAILDLRGGFGDRSGY